MDDIALIQPFAISSSAEMGYTRPDSITTTPTPPPPPHTQIHPTPQGQDLLLLPVMVSCIYLPPRVQ